MTSRTSVFVLAATVGTLAACGRAPEASVDELRPVRSIVAGSTAGGVDATYSGQVLARHESRLAFQTGGRIVARLVDVGQQVRRGQALMRLDPEQQALQVLAADADADAARSRVAQNQADLQRAEQLLARRFASPAEVEQQRLALAQSESQLRAALAQQRIQVNQRGWTTLVADRDGVVSAIQAESGQVVSPGQPVLTLAGDGAREVLVSVPESRVDELKRARELSVTAWALPGKSWRGSLRELAPDTDSVSRTYAARIAIEAPDASLRLGMTASVHARDVDGRPALRLPLTAIVDDDAGPSVWVVDRSSGQVARLRVELGAVQQDAVIVTGGLAGGETVVTAGVHMLHAGQRVRLDGGRP